MPLDDYRIENLNDEFSPYDWNQYILLKNTDEIRYGIAHNPSVRSILAEYLNAEVSQIRIADKNNQTCGLIQAIIIKNKFFSLPVFPISGIFSHSDDYKISLYKVLLQGLNQYEIRDTIKFSKYALSSKYLCYLNLKTNPTEQLNSFKAKLRNQIIKGNSYNLKLIIGNEELLDEFYIIYAANMHRIGSPVIEKRFFILLLKNYKYGLKKIFLLKKEGATIGGSIALSYGDLFEVGWASTDKKHNHLKTNMVLYWDMIRYAIEQNMKVFSFGRATKNSSSYQFKKQWQGEFIQIFFNYDSPRFDIRSFALLQAVWKFIPNLLANKIGPVIRKQLE